MSDSLLGRQRRPRDSLATKIIFFVFLSTFVTALVVSWTSVHSTYSFLRSHLNGSYPALLERSEAQLRDWLAEGEATAVQLASRPELRLALAGDGRARAAAEALLGEVFEGAPRRFTVLLVRDARGSTRLRAGGGAPPLEPGASAPLPERAALREVSGVLVASAPIRDARGTPIGAVEGVFSRDSLAAQLASHAGSGSAVYLVDGGGQVVTSSPVPASTRFASFPLTLMERLTSAPAFEFRGDEGRRGIGARRPLPFGGWSLVVAQPIEQAFAPVFSVVTRIFVIDLAIVLLFSFFAYEITAAIVRPLEALSDGARRISQGELEVEIPDTRTHDEIGLLTRTFNDMARRLRRNRSEIDQQHSQLQEQNEQLQQANEVLEQLSITDGLTKLHNHRYFQDTLTREIKRVSRTAEPLSMLLVDIDDFKALNDRLGHAEGDALLARIARILNESVRESDVLARYGGEEFVVLATGTDLEGALFVAEKVRTAVAEASFGTDPAGGATRITVSIGVAEFEGDRRRFFDAADRALYRAKAAGKNCVVAAERP